MIGGNWNMATPPIKAQPLKAIARKAGKLVLRAMRYHDELSIGIGGPLYLYDRQAMQ